MGRLATALLLVIGLSTPAGAQELAVSVATYSSFGVGDLDGDFPPSAEFRATVPLSDRLALEPFVTVASRGKHRSPGVEGFYGAQIRHRIAPLTGRDLYAFATYGVAAYYSTYGSVAPIFGHFGIGLHQPIAGRLAFRPEVQLVTFHVVPIGARFLAGLSVAVAPDRR